MGDSDGGKKRNGISRSLKRFFGVGDFGFSFMTNIETYYFTYFLTNIAEFSLPIVTMITTIASVVDAALSWIYGVILDTFKPMKWGRYRSWLVVIPWLVPFLYAFQFVRVGSGTAAVVIIIAATITSHIAWNIPFVANISMINMASKTPEDRMALSSSRAIWQSLGRVFYSYVGPAVVAVMAGIVCLYMDSLCSHHAEIQYLYLIHNVYNVIILPFHSCKKKREPFTALFHIDFLIHLSYSTVCQPMSLNFFPKMGQSLVLHQMPSQLLSFDHILLQIPMQIHSSKHLSE